MIEIREGRDEDAAGLIELIGTAYSEYPGCILDVDREEPDLRAVATAYRRRDGRFWVAERAGRVVGSIGCAPSTEGMQLFKFYVARSERRQGLGSKLETFVETEARQRKFAMLHLWTDTRFTDAHAFYRGRGYRETGEVRDLHDLSNSLEYHFLKTL